MYFSYHMMMFVNYVEGIQEENSRLVKIYPLLSLILNPCQTCSQILSVPSNDHRDTLAYDATLPVLQDFQQYPIF